VDHRHVPLRGEVQLLERRPLLRADAEHVETEPDIRPGLRAGCGKGAAGAERDGGGAGGLQKRTAIRANSPASRVLPAEAGSHTE
jgi:hypothetical protein